MWRGAPIIWFWECRYMLANASVIDCWTFLVGASYRRLDSCLSRWHIRPWWEEPGEMSRYLSLCLRSMNDWLCNGLIASGEERRAAGEGVFGITKDSKRHKQRTKHDGLIHRCTQCVQHESCRGWQFLVHAERNKLESQTLSFHFYREPSTATFRHLLLSRKGRIQPDASP